MKKSIISNALVSLTSIVIVLFTAEIIMRFAWQMGGWVERPTLFANDTPPKPLENYNVVLVFIDTLRADHLSCYNYFRNTSPHIDSLAKEGIIFEQNFSPSTNTLPSFTSIITSLYPESHGVISICKDRLSPKIKTLAQILQMHGYKTAWFGPDEPHLDPKIGFGWGFQRVDLVASSKLSTEREALCAWLDSNRDTKFFLNFHSYKIHRPYQSSLKYKHKFTKNKIEGIIEDAGQYYGSVYKFMKEGLCQNKEKGIGLFGEGALFNQFVASGLLNEDFHDTKIQSEIEHFFEVRGKLPVLYRIRDYVYWRGMNLADSKVNAHVQSLYDAAILEFDEEVVGPVVDKLKALNLYDKTIIIICSDHGEEFYEHGYHEHSRTLYDEVTHVPLIMRIPWIKHGKRIKELTQTVDIMPTLLGLLGIPAPHEAQGKSMVGLINNKESSSLHEYVFGQFPASRISSIRSKEWLLILHDNGKKELYHLLSDPREQRDVSYVNQGVVLKLESDFKKWKASLPSYKDKEYSFPPWVDKETQERIRKTGYW